VGKVIKIPAVIHIGPVDYEVKIVKGLSSTDEDGNAQKLYGHIQYGAVQINLEKDMADVAKVTVLWHEVIHGLLYQAGYVEHTEEMVLALGYAIYGLIRANPELIELTLKV
jgi:hypothetical protein